MQSKTLVVAVLVAIAWNAGWSPSAVQAQTAAGSEAAERPVRALIDAMRRNDPAGIRAAFAANATQAYGDGSPKQGDAFSRWLKSDIIDRHGQVAEPKFAVSGSDVVVTGNYRNNAGYTSPANFLFRVENGSIVSWRMRY